MKILAALIPLFLCSSGFSQSIDAELWTELGLKADIGEKLSLKYETQARFYKNANVLKTYYNEISGEYEVIKNLSLGLGYRFSQKDREGYYGNENRMVVDLEFGDKVKVLDLKLKARARYQHAFDRISKINDVIYPDWSNAFRLKLEAQYEHDDFKRVSPYVGYELFKEINLGHLAGISSFRLYGGLDFDLPARHEIGLKYIFDRENDSSPNIMHIYLIQYNYELPSKWFKKEKK